MNMDFSGLAGAPDHTRARRTHTTESLITFATAKHDAAAAAIAEKTTQLQALAALAVRDLLEIGGNEQAGMQTLVNEITRLESQHDFWAAAIAGLGA
jgi:hypothetical protein